MKLFKSWINWITPNLGGNDGGSQQTVQNSEPWSGVQPYITDYLKKSQTQFNAPFNANYGDTVAGFSPEQQYGLAAITQRAVNGSPVSSAASQNAYSTLNGDYISPDSNPWLKANVDQAMNDVTGRINSQFNNNNFGSSAHQELLSRSLGDTAANIYGQNYQDERGRQMNVIGMAPTLAQSDYNDANMLIGAGAQRQNMAQQYLDAANGTYNNFLNFPQNQLNNYGGAVGRGMGSGGTSTSTTTGSNGGSNDFANLIGTGLSLYGAFGGF